LADCVLTRSDRRYGIDTSNVLASGKSSYVATQDCWAWASGANLSMKIDSLEVAHVWHSTTPAACLTAIIFLKKEQKYSGSSATIYGLK